MINNLKLNVKPLRIRKGISLVEGSLPGNEKTAIGVDPGIDYGLTIINRDFVQVFFGRLETNKRPGYRGINAYNYIMNSALNTYRSVNPEIRKSVSAVVEGASYNDIYGQVALEEVRFGFFFALYEIGFTVSIVPPATIRKGALGHGRATVGEIFPNLNHNACDSIGAAIYALSSTRDM